MPDSRSTGRHPLLSLLLLLLLIFIGGIVFTLLGAVIGGTIYGFPALLKFLGGDMVSNIGLTKLIQITSSIGMFIIPAIVFARLENKEWKDYLKLNPFIPILFLLTVLLMFFSVPLMELSVKINQGMKLPGFLRGLEEWMRLKEDQTAELTKQLLTMKTFSSLIVNLFMLAVIPAIGEEFIFRGSLQRVLKQLFGNHHVAIWLTAILFSAIHMQFYGFIPRMLLGAMFGYLLFWSNTIWLPILAHFINNATAVLTAYVYQQQGKDLSQLDQPEKSSWLIYLASLILTITMLWYFHQRAQQSRLSISPKDGTRVD
jgi:membrane protease YdiL (CAAX protease family)